MYVAKTKALISFAVHAKLICIFVFAYAKCWFSHDAAHMNNSYICKFWFSHDAAHMNNSYILKRKKLATVVHPLFFQYGPYEDILMSVPYFPAQ